MAGFVRDLLRREDSFIHFGTIYGADGEHRTPYMTRVWIGRLRLHIFHRGDADPDPHDHPWDFWTFPLTSYVEEIYLPDRFSGRGFARQCQLVPAYRLSFRAAEHTHRVIGRWTGEYDHDWAGRRRFDPPRPRSGPGKIITVVWRGRPRRKWGFLKSRDGLWCWIAWRDYVFGGGKNAPCGPAGGGPR